jgi:hypothetical protein
LLVLEALLQRLLPFLHAIGIAELDHIHKAARQFGQVGCMVAPLPLVAALKYIVIGREMAASD